MFRSWLKKIKAWWPQEKGASEQRPAPSPSAQQAAGAAPLAKLDRVILTDGVANTLFDDYLSHRHSPRGDEEIGWVLLGMRQQGKAIALAALPAGTQRDSGVAHVRFNSDAQELASRILRQKDKRLGILGVVHTHPGSLRHPSAGDFQGDRVWVSQLRGGEGIFGIGTADARAAEAQTAQDGHRQCRGDLCFSWYVLGHGDSQYRPMPVEVAAGLDQAQPLHAIWDILEAYAKPLNRLCRQLARVQFEVISEASESLLAVHINLVEPHEQLRLLLNDHEARYYWNRQGEVVAIDPREPQPDCAVYLILAELAKALHRVSHESSLLVES